MMMRVALIVLSLAAACSGILPEIVDTGIGHIIQEDHHYVPDLNSLVRVEQLPEEPRKKSEDDAFHQSNNSVSPTPHPNQIPPSHPNESASDNVIDNEAVNTSPDQETNNITTDLQSSELGNNIDHGCVIDKDCGKGSYCLSDIHNSRCLPCKAVDVPCTKDAECCSEQLCVWGQCTQNATQGEAGSTCLHQTDCSPDLCCAFHKVLFFAVCTSKPIERERCFGASNHLVELLAWDVQEQGPRKHCPCAGDLHCQHLGRGSMCLKGEDSSEEDLTDSLYSEIDYII